MYIVVEALHCIPKMNARPYANYTSIKIKIREKIDMARIRRVSFIGSIFSSSVVYKITARLAKEVMLGLIERYILSANIARALTLHQAATRGSPCGVVHSDTEFIITRTPSAVCSERVMHGRQCEYKPGA